MFYVKNIFSAVSITSITNFHTTGIVVRLMCTVFDFEFDINIRLLKYMYKHHLMMISMFVSAEIIR